MEINYSWSKNPVFILELKNYEKLYISKFVWKKLPPNIDQSFLEKGLFYFGKMLSTNSNESIKNNSADKIIYPFTYNHLILKGMTDFSFLHSNISIVPYAGMLKPVKPPTMQLQEMPFMFSNMDQVSPFLTTEYDIYLLSQIKRVLKTNNYNLANQLIFLSNEKDKRLNEILSAMDADNVEPIKRIPAATKKLDELGIKKENYDFTKSGVDNTSSVFFSIQSIEQKIEEKLGLFSGQIQKKTSAQESGDSQINNFNKTILILKDELMSRKKGIKNLRKVDSRWNETTVEFNPFLIKKMSEIENNIEEKISDTKIDKSGTSDNKIKESDTNEKV